MIKDYKHFDLENRVIIEKIRFTTPLRKDGSMENAACFLYHINGANTIYGSSQKENVTSNEAILMKCGNYVTSYQATEKHEAEIIVIHLYPETLKRIFKNELPDFLKSISKSNSIHVQKVKVETIIKNYIDSILFYFDNPSLVTEELISLKVKELLLVLSSTNYNQDKVLFILKSLFDKAEINFKSVIEQNIYEDLTLDELATLTNLSLASFKRRFTTIYGTSPAKYIRQEKLVRAKSLIESSNLPISEVCFECGFNGNSNFAKAFSTHFGISPTDYRKQTKMTTI